MTVVRGRRFRRALAWGLGGVMGVAVVLGVVSQVWFVQMSGNWENEGRTRGASMGVAVGGGYLFLGGELYGVSGKLEEKVGLTSAYAYRRGGLWWDAMRGGREVVKQIFKSPNTQSFMGLGKNFLTSRVPAVSPGANPNPPIRTTYTGTVMVHLGYVVGLAGVYPGVYAWRHRRRRPRHVCRGCGYDLRATADADGPLVERCPECGRERR